MSKRFPELVSVLDDGYTTLSPDRSHVLSFDREGRLVGFFRKGLTYRRSLDSRVVLRWRDGTRQRRWLSEPEAYSLYEDAYGLAREIAQDVQGELQRRLLEEVLRWDPRTLLAEGRCFRSVYHSVPILPPDQYRSIVLQITEGCTWNRCTFCNFYEGRRFRMRTLGQYEKHIQAVKNFFGAGIRMRHGIFLGDGNALALGVDRLAEYMTMTHKFFPDQPLFGFVDVYSGERHTVEEWRTLRDLGLRRVYIGMESGCDSLLEFLNKPNTAEDTIALVRDMKEAGLAVSPIVMVGIGGHKYSKMHEQETLRVLEQMPLGDGDILYLSPFVEHPDSQYAHDRVEAGIAPMQEDEIEEALRRMSVRTRKLGIKTSRYDIRDFIY